MFLRRSDAASETLVRDQTTGAEILNADDLDFDHRATPRFRLIRENCCCKGWDIGYFGTDSWTSTEFSGDTITPAYELPGFLLPSTAPGTVYRTNYGTDLHSFELNYRTKCGECLTLLAGFRWIELADELDVDQVAPVQQDIFTIDTNNHMYGFQIGMDAAVWNCGQRFYVNTLLRAAILSNRADQSTSAPFLTGTPGFVDTLSRRDNHTAFFGELGVQGVYWLNQRIAVQGGYHLMWLEGVALAPEQIPVNNLIIPGTAALDTSGSLFFDGATVGLMVRF